MCEGSLKLSRLFVLSTVVLLSLVLLVVGRAMWQDWKVVRAASTGLELLELTANVMVVAEKASAERGPVIPVVNDGVPADPTKRERLTKFRSNTDEVFVKAENSLGNLART
jgi:hypothetical protein